MLVILRIACVISFTLSPLTFADDAGNCDVVQVFDCELDQAVNPEKSGWTLGVGMAAAQNIPHYIGSDESRNFVLPVPYITYDSPKLKVGQGGITGRLFNSDNWYLSLSLSGALPVDSDNNQARNGMGDIEAVFEYGPSLKYYFSGNETSADAVFFDLNFREARTLSLTGLDFSSSPTLVIRRQWPTPVFSGALNWIVRIKQEYVSNAYADYFYGVANEDVTDQRPAYKAKGGEAGHRLSTNVRWQKGKHIVNFFLGHADITSAKYVSSPLVRTNRHTFGGLTYFKLF